MHMLGLNYLYGCATHCVFPCFNDQSCSISYVYLCFQALVNPADISSFGGETRPVQILFLKNWPDSHKVPTQNYSVLDLIDNSCQWRRTQNALNTPTLVISKSVLIYNLHLKPSHTMHKTAKKYSCLPYTLQHFLTTATIF